MPSMHLSQLRRWLLQSPPVEWAIMALRNLLIGAIRQGPVPQHVAFVMDGNRRYARERGIEIVEGHNQGFEALAKILEVCYKSGVKVVTIYAFSIENFKRSKYEVDALMDMAKVKLAQLAQHDDLLQHYGAQIRILGQRELIKPDVLQAMDKAVNMTKNNGEAILNICCPYTSHAEITAAIHDTVVDYSKPLAVPARAFSESHITHNIRARRLSATTIHHHSPSVSSNSSASQLGNSPPHLPRSHSPSLASSTSTLTLPSDSGDDLASSIATTPNQMTNATNTPPSFDVDSDTLKSTTSPNTFPDPESITAETLTAHMYTAGLPKLDLMIRTSGVERLSDFMLWQTHENTEIAFLKCLWPDFNLWRFLPVLVEWQWNQRHVIKTTDRRKAKVV